ncbi:uncharacterized protein [Onthophagus taurus]|uniref:uncharacterized protein n=1 Tax=Onthophagus taurus TaxID=166361 RepID=UPI000C204261|nr:uncharacterized protein LOC111428557 [Onthophagus taurus]XP_022919896.1 uncharacterized protein LOC111428557 [Onthophagus taurus]XP_022919897.1 uncharacterized protein LOC111428557 [Onthophagus taurus]XP_022919898.1 uncharacterized protein LOC111428557 [Onthophagus taurus]
MLRLIAILGLLFALLNGNYRSFVAKAASVPKDQGSSENSAQDIPRYMDDAVKELENLKNTVGSTLEMMKSHSEMYSNYNGQEKGHSVTKEQLNEDGKMIASIDQDVDQASPGEGKEPQGKVRTKIDIPSKGIHKTLIQHLNKNNEVHEHKNTKEKDKDDDEDERPIGVVKGIGDDTNEMTRRSSQNDNIEIDNNNNNEKPITQYGINQYSPVDMAEYVFWTGDEKRVTLAIEEYLQEGLMTREEAITFLEDIKFNLDYLQNYYNRLGLKSKEILEKPLTHPNPYLKQLQTKPNIIDKKKNFEPVIVKSQILVPSSEEDEYSQLLERLRVADFLYTEYSLEEVIYQLAKVMFTQSLTRGSSEAQRALEKFTLFLETEANQGRISRGLEKKVLDVLIASLTDTLNEHPELQMGEDLEDEQKRNQNVMNELLKYNAKRGVNNKI